MTKNKLYAENMLVAHLSPHIYYSVLYSDSILMLVLISQIQLQTAQVNMFEQGQMQLVGGSLGLSSV